MDDRRFGTAIREVRRRKAWRQHDLGTRAGVSQATISRIERGHCASLSLDTIRAVAAALDMRTELHAWWRAGELDRLLNARHSALHESVARAFQTRWPDWMLAPEVSFAIYGERGVIDILAWHPGRRALLVIELKTDIADVNELVGTADRKRRLAANVARDRGWEPDTVSVWLIVADGRTNQARVAEHRAMLRGAFPLDGRSARHWLPDPGEAVSMLSFWPAAVPVRRVSAPRTPRSRPRPRRPTTGSPMS